MPDVSFFDTHILMWLKKNMHVKFFTPVSVQVENWLTI